MDLAANDDQLAAVIGHEAAHVVARHAADGNSTTPANPTLAQQHPDLEDLAIHPLDTGFDNYIFRLGDDYCLRFPRRTAAAEIVVGANAKLRARLLAINTIGEAFGDAKVRARSLRVEQPTSEAVRAQTGIASEQGGNQGDMHGMVFCLQ